MLDGWYCRTMANQQATMEQNENDVNDIEEGSSDEESVNQHQAVDFKAQYQILKKKFKFLIYENEFLQDSLRITQRRYLKASRDKSFLLDKLLQYEKPELTSSESEETETSDDEGTRSDQVKRKKLDGISSGTNSIQSRNSNVQPKRKKAVVKKPQVHITGSAPNLPSDGHMTAEEIERHLQSRHSLMELLPERAPPTVPHEMFSNEPSLDSESNECGIETSPSNIGDID
ncbi:INO80 complex subunit E isoform X2 [Phlebotomus papatasi]|uniref:INO80 complex subunit E N-terminal domain-containing protein n=1 Tax=Phlebotomus papatasi TaxID=29031 RepID=A0A1B0DQA3_PHLPP|nr:INO80 complex subunit E isoform X2 [Phlebotomus papatasi]